VNQPSLVARTFEEKRQIMRGEKELIARKAAEYVRPGMSIALDSGTTAWRVAAALKKKAPLTVVTSALAVVEELGSIEGMTIILTGGKFRLANLDFIGQSGIGIFPGIHCELAFLSGDSFIPGKGVYAVDAENAAMGLAMASCSGKRIVVIDHSKFSGKGCYQIIPEKDIDILITDASMDPETRASLENTSFETVIAV
jgi:DeoR/GlpR family transcriptional regulator of sugar metabolism